MPIKAPIAPVAVVADTVEMMRAAIKRDVMVEWEVDAAKLDKFTDEKKNSVHSKIQRMAFLLAKCCHYPALLTLMELTDEFSFDLFCVFRY